MLPLTADKPKPLLSVGSKSLIEHQIERLRRAGLTELVINVAYLGEQIQAALGDGGDLGVQIQYSPESAPLETGGGINNALPLLGEQPFVLLNSDVWCDYPLAELVDRPVAPGGAHLVLVNNPEHNDSGDFSLNAAGKVSLQGQSAYTFSGISVIDPQLISTYPNRREFFPLKEALVWAASRGVLTGELYRGQWIDVGTPERLAQVAELSLSGAQ